MRSDLEALGYMLEYGPVDSQKYLLPQRRNRIYATADVENGQSVEEYQAKMTATMDAMSSNFIIPVDSILDPDLPGEPLTTERQEHLRKDATERASDPHHGEHVFIDGSTSSSRKSEFATDVFTCIRPSHGIYSCKLGRWVTVGEMWAAQGLWANNFENPEAVDEMLKDTKAAQDLVGNAFSSTVMQAKVLASIVHSCGWESVGHGTMRQQEQVVVVSELDSIGKGSGLSTPQASYSSSLKRSASSFSGASGSSKKPLDKRESPSVVQPETVKRRRYCGKSKPRLECEKASANSMAYLSQPGLSGDACKEHVEALRVASAGIKRAASDQQGGGPKKKKRTYKSNGKIAREGKKGVVSIYRKVELLKVPGLCHSTISLCIYIYVIVNLCMCRKRIFVPKGIGFLIYI